MLESYEFDSMYDGVLIASSALARNGLTTMDPSYLILATHYKSADGFRLQGHGYNYIPNIDFENYLLSSPSNPNLLVPTAERAIAESIKYINIIDEGTLVESIYTYKQLHPDLSELRKVCRFYGVSDEELDYWLSEADDYTGA